MLRNERASSSDNNQLENLILPELEDQSKTIPVNSALYGQLICIISLLCGLFILPALYKNESANSTDTFSSVNYMQLIAWVIVTILTWYVKAEHKKSRIYGYHEFYDSTRHLHRVTFYMLSGGNVLLLVINCVTHNFCLGGGSSPCNSEIQLTPVNYLQIIIGMEITIVIPFLIKHIVEVTQFNQKGSPPDVYKDQTNYQQGQVNLTMGERDQGFMERLLTHQADQIMTQNKRTEILQQQVDELMKIHMLRRSENDENVQSNYSPT